MTNSIDDINQAKCILAIGTNTTEAHPIIGMNIRKAVRQGTKLIVANPLEINLVRDADIWLQHHAGTDVVLLMGMMKIIVDEKLTDLNFIEERCENYEAFKESLNDYPLEMVTDITGVPGEKIIEAARMFQVGKAVLAAMNPALNQAITVRGKKIPRGTTLRLPVEASVLGAKVITGLSLPLPGF